MNTEIEEALIRLVSAINHAVDDDTAERHKGGYLDCALKQADRALRNAGYVADGITGETYFKETT